MSKRLKNYPEPGIVLDKYGADALRLYLINSPVVRAETLKFKEEGVKEIISKVFLPWYNAFKFFITQTAVLKKVKIFICIIIIILFTHTTLFQRNSILTLCINTTSRSQTMSWIAGCLPVASH